MTSRNIRARPLPPEERRAAILHATVPLVREHGLAVSTRQIAKAAGVAEGTLFRVFPDKRALLKAAVEAALDPDAGAAALAKVDRSLPLEQRLAAVLDLMREGIEATWQLFAAIRATETDKNKLPLMEVRRSFEPLTKALAELLEPDAHRLRVTPRKAARLVGPMLMVTLHQARAEPTDEPPFTTAELVDTFLHGVACPDPDGCSTSDQIEGSHQC
ncbi:TetR/AcrR family transcriptional regulator [Flindersiella endophytica]